MTSWCKMTVLVPLIYGTQMKTGEEECALFQQDFHHFLVPVNGRKCVSYFMKCFYKSSFLRCNYNKKRFIILATCL